MVRPVAEPPQLKQSCLSTRSLNHVSFHNARAEGRSPWTHRCRTGTAPADPPPAQEQPRGAGAAGSSLPHLGQASCFPTKTSQPNATKRKRLLQEACSRTGTNQTNKQKQQSLPGHKENSIDLPFSSAERRSKGSHDKHMNLSHWQRKLISCGGCPEGQGSFMMHFLPETQTHVHTNTWQQFSSTKIKNISARRRLFSTRQHSL